MATKKKTTKKKSNQKEGHGLMIAALAAAAAAGGYFLYGSKNAKQNRKQVKGWMLKAKGEVLEKIEKGKNLSKADYEKMVDTVVNRYKKMKSTNSKEVEALGKELKAHWKDIEKEAEKKSTRTR